MIYCLIADFKKLAVLCKFLSLKKFYILIKTSDKTVFGAFWKDCQTKKVLHALKCLVSLKLF